MSLPVRRVVSILAVDVQLSRGVPADAPELPHLRHLADGDGQRGGPEQTHEQQAGDQRSVAGRPLGEREVEEADAEHRLGFGLQQRYHLVESVEAGVDGSQCLVGVLDGPL